MLGRIIRSFEPAASFEHLNLIAIRVSDKKEPCENRTIRSKFDQLAGVEAFGLSGFHLFAANSMSVDAHKYMNRH